MNVTTDSTLTIVVQHLNIWYGTFLLIIGNVGCLINLILFCSKSFYQSSFSIYFLATTCANLFLLNFVLLTRILQYGFMFHIYQTYKYLCQFRAYISSLTSALSFSFFLMISIDRFLSTHPKAFYRSWGNRYTLAIKLIPCIILFWMMILLHRLILYQFDPMTGLCEPKLDIYWWYNGYYKLIFTGFLPLIIILIISCMLVRNIRLIVHRKNTSLNEISVYQKKCSRLQKLDNQLTLMLLIQLIVSLISFIPYNSQLLYLKLSQNLIKSTNYLFWENILIEFIHLSSYLFYSTNSYIFLLSSQIFRKQIFQLFSSKQMKKNNNHSII